MASHKTLLLFLSLFSLSFTTLSLNLNHPSSQDGHDLLSFSFTTLSLLDLDRSFSSSAAAATDVHDLLPTYGLPKGLIPNRVKSYTLSDDGAFTVEFESHCYVHFDKELVYYEKKISGKLSYGSVYDVVGIHAKKLFVWVPVTGIGSNPGSGTIEFFVGFVSEKMPAKQFEDIPVCKSKASSEETDLVESI